jgi:hypothetical protein
MTHRKLDTLLTAHNVTNADRPAIRALVECGTKPPQRIRRKLGNQYANCLGDVLTELSKPLDHLFPKNWRPIHLIPEGTP